MVDSDRAAVWRPYIADLVQIKEQADMLSVFYDQLERLWFAAFDREAGSLRRWFSKTARSGLWEYTRFTAACAHMPAAGPAAGGLSALCARVQADYEFFTHLLVTADEEVYQRIWQARENAQALSRAVAARLRDVAG